MKSLKYSIMAVCAAFVCAICLLTAMITYRMYTSSVYERYQEELASVLDYVETYIDTDDMAECVRTNQASAAYESCQELFDRFIDTFSDLHYLYISRAVVEDEAMSLRAVCSANSSYEKEFEPGNVLHLGDWEPDWYDERTIVRFWTIQNGSEDVYFENTSEWGSDYTLVRPLIDSQGEHFAVLCADISIADIQQTILWSIARNVAILMVCCIAFTSLLLLWLQHNVTTPLGLLQESVAGFANAPGGKHDLDDLYHPPVLKVHNEIALLSDEITKLSVSMRNYIIDAVSAENVANALRSRVTEFHSFAYQDPLTKVKNRAAYDKGLEILRGDIRKDEAEFAFVLVDVNYSRKISNSYGPEYGDRYIAGCCKLVCQVYKHSPVYRVGDDEFVAIVQDESYRERDALLDHLNDLFITSSNDDSAVPWEKYSAAAGMSVYQPGDTVEAVFERAEKQMYEAKTRMKRALQQYRWDN